MSYRNKFNLGAVRKLKISPISRFWKENTPFRDGKSKEELPRNARVSTAEIKHDERADLKSTFLKSADFLGNVRVLLGMQHTNNYRFDCEFVLKYYSDRSSRGENYTLLLLRPIKRPTWIIFFI